MNKTIYILSSIIVLLLVSCSDEMHDREGAYSDVPSPLVVYASINGTALTRAKITETEDQWSYTDFEAKDAMGFYSSGGKWDGEAGNGKEPFINQKLIYSGNGTQFNDPDGVQFSPTNMKGSEIYMYFPYNENMDKEKGGMELRITNGVEDDTLRCIDLLSSNELTMQGKENGKNMALYGDFYHAFSELIIMRGEGFDNPPKGKEQITAVLQDPFTNIRVKVSNDGTWSCTPDLYFNQDNKAGLTQEQARRWDAWFGGNYGITNEDPDGTPAWYIIVPTIGCDVNPKKKAGYRSTVSYIELYDNDGYLQQVKSLKLSGANSKYVDAGWRYPMTISMKELVPTVNPFPILPWNEDVNLTDERKRGINNEADFALWVQAYNAYLNDPTDDKINGLYNYGDMYVSDKGEKTWHFYVLSDIDLTNYNSTDNVNETLIAQLTDTLDGVSTTFVNGKFLNHTIKGLTKTFINGMSGNGTLQNFDFIEPEIIDENEESTAPAGIIVNEMKTGTSVINCNIKKGTMFHPKGPAGMVAGSMTNAQVSGCTLSGFIVSEGSDEGEGDKIAGKFTSDCLFSDNDVDEVITE